MDEPIDPPENQNLETKPHATEQSALPQVKKRRFLRPHETNKKKLIIASSVMVSLLVLSIAWMVLGNKVPDPATSQVTEETKLGAAITLIDGTANILKSGGEAAALTTETVPEEGDRITTDTASRVIITLDDGSIVRVDESSTIRISSLDADDIRFSNELGNVYSRVVTSDRKFSVSVDGTDFTALGTAFKTVNAETVKGVQVLQSSVSVEDMEQKVEEGKQFFKAHTTAELTDKVTDVSVDELKSDSFMLWNLEQDKQAAEFKDKLGYLAKIEEQAATPAPTTSASASIKLSATTYDKGVTLKWTVSGVSGQKGFKVVRSKKTSTPTFGKDEASYADGANTRTLNWKDYGGVTYTYRVCAYYGDSCTNYSNAVTIASPYIPPEPVEAGTVTLLMTSNVASWTYTGTAPHGFKVLVNTTSGVSYANSQKAYASSSPITLDDLDPGSYYVRVCKRTGDGNISGGCTDYSNEETLVVP